MKIITARQTPTTRRSSSTAQQAQAVADDQQTGADIGEYGYPQACLAGEGEG
jgi:hypothetical protein